MKFAFSALFLAIASVGLVAALPVEIKDAILAREPVTDPCPEGLVCASEAR
ncbi:hypothetical protein DFH09DRAFT_1384025 [Mycena vulgaris]|nr:hypothetical protein DFH09DRAFT_1384025 [Mycena vulgaris]